MDVAVTSALPIEAVFVAPAKLPAKASPAFAVLPTEEPSAVAIASESIFVVTRTAPPRDVRAVLSAIVASEVGIATLTAIAAARPSVGSARSASSWPSSRMSTQLGTVGMSLSSMNGMSIMLPMCWSRSRLPNPPSWFAVASAFEVTSDRAVTWTFPPAVRSRAMRAVVVSRATVTAIAAPAAASAPVVSEVAVVVMRFVCVATTSTVVPTERAVAPASISAVVVGLEKDTAAAAPNPTSASDPASAVVVTPCVPADSMSIAPAPATTPEPSAARVVGSTVLAAIEPPMPIIGSAGTVESAPAVLMVA